MTIGESPVDMLDTLISNRWTLKLPPHRHQRDDWATWEVERLAAEHKLISSMHHPIVYCIGSEEGDFPALYSSWGADTVLVEPNPHVWANIRAIWNANELSPPLHVEVGLCGDEDREAGGDDPKRAWVIAQRQLQTDGWPSCAHGPVIGNHGFVALFDGVEQAQQIKVDTIVRKTGLAPNIVTMDVEGGELLVLRGMTETLETIRPHLFISVHPPFMSEMYGHEPEQLYRFLDAYDYERTHLAFDHESHEMFTPR